MTVQKLVEKCAPVLHTPAEKVPAEKIGSEEIAGVVQSMKDTLRKYPDGVALAAPQIGEPWRIFVVSGHIFDQKALENDDKSSYSAPDLVFINPKITHSSKEKGGMVEGCLSVRWTYGEVERANEVEIEALNERGEKITQTGHGLLAQIFQHEIDHLGGKLFTERAKNLREVKPHKQSNPL